MKRYRTIIYITSIVILLFGIITTGKRIYIDSTKYKLYNITLLTINNKTIVNKPKLLTIEEIKNSNGLLMSITSSKDECIPIKLNIYENGTYKLYNKYKTCKSCDKGYKYKKAKTGKYTADVLKLVNHGVNAKRLNSDDYKIILGNDNIVLTDNNNYHLKQLMKEIKVDLNKCAKK